MTANYGAFCTDYYVNLKLGLKLELPKGRDTVLSLFERVRRQYPGMTEFRKYKEELALESPTSTSPHRWVAVRSSSIRAGVVNPSGVSEAYRLHRCVLDISPYFLSISPLDVDYVELLYGFDIAASGNHDSVVAETLLGNSPLASLLDIEQARPIDCQPVLGFVLPSGAEAYFEVKTRPGNDSKRDSSDEPISVYLTLRRHGPIGELKQLGEILDELITHGEELVEGRVIPTLVNPIRNAIVPGF
ncbi:MAG TPA: hypothetical protein VFF69_13500 [Phycisphaerales bacterium]|nr:hypothetical protein [Phycisphaerales bacterium]